jgi:hypothetical protein
VGNYSVIFFCLILLRKKFLYLQYKKISDRLLSAMAKFFRQLRKKALQAKKPVYKVNIGD